MTQDQQAHDDTRAGEQEDIAEQEDRAISLTDLAVNHFKSTLRDPQATDTAKTSAANGLAQIERQMDKALKGQIHRLDRSELLAEIARIKTKLAISA